MKRFAAWILLGFLLTGCSTTRGNPVAGLPAMDQQAVATAFTTRLPAHDPETQAIVLSQAVYPATQEQNSAGAIILAPQQAPLAFTAMQGVSPMPINAPLLYLTPQGRLSSQTFQEMKRLHPYGVMQDANIQVYVVGPVNPAIVQLIQQQLGYRTRQFATADPVILAEMLDRWQAGIKTRRSDAVVVSALDHPDGLRDGLGAMSWNVQSGEGFAWVNRNSVPDATRRILQRRTGNCTLYLTGGPEVISDAVARELSAYGPVRRIAGDDAMTSQVVSAEFRDSSTHRHGWWGAGSREVGWGVSSAGHNVIVANSADVLGAIPAAILSQQGAHGPLLLVSNQGVSGPVSQYLNRIRPSPAGPDQTILNHAWIIGDASRIDPAVQRQIDGLMRPAGGKESHG